MSLWETAKNFLSGTGAIEHSGADVPSAPVSGVLDQSPSAGTVDGDWVPRTLGGEAVNLSTIPTFQWGKRDLLSAASYAGFNTVLPPPSAITYWRDYGFDTQTLSRATPNALIEMLTDISPDISKAVWDIERFCNPGWEIFVTRVGGSSLYPKGEKALDAFLTSLASYQGDLEIFFGRLFMAAFVRGAIMTELIVDGTTPIDIAVPDPAIARFKRIKDPVRGETWELGYMN